MAKDPAARGIYKRGNIYWFAMQRDGIRYPPVSLETGDYSEAIIRAGKIRDNPLLNKGKCLQSDVERFISYKRKVGEWTRSTAESKGYVVKEFAKSFPDLTATPAITTSHVQRWYNNLLKECAKSTANGYLMAVQSFFRWTIEVEKIARRNPCDEVNTVEVKTAARKDFCDFDLRDNLINDCDDDELQFILYCGFHAGFRKMEIIEARPFWFDLTHRIVHMRKTETYVFKDFEERSIPMTKEFYKFLQGYGLREPFMLRPDKLHGKYIYRYDFEARFKAYMKSKGVPWVTPHIMRHTFASLLATKGVSIYLIAQWLGDDVRTTQKHYAKLLPMHSEIQKAF